MDFAVKAGFISEADAVDAKKYKITSSPGNCKSKADCEAFCVLPENQDTCFKFAKDHGMISEEDLKNIEQYRNQGPPDFSQVNPKWLTCMEKEMGSAAFGRFKAGKSDRSDVSAIQAAQKKCQSEMGPDTKECLTKPTCEEFFSCLNPSGSRTSQQGGPEQKSPPELKERMDSCQDELKETKKKEIDAEMDACLSRSCSEFDACIKSVQQGSSGEQQSGQQDQGTPNPKLNAKIDACQKEKVNACLAKSCGEFQACLNSLGSGGGGGVTPDPAVLAKVKSCQPPPPSGGQQRQGGDQSGIPQGTLLGKNFVRQIIPILVARVSRVSPTCGRPILTT